MIVEVVEIMEEGKQKSEETPDQYIERMKTFYRRELLPAPDINFSCNI